MKKWGLIFLLCLLITSIRAQDLEQIKQVLGQQTQAWNRGDLNGFMQGYWASDSLLFVGKSGPQYGWNRTLENYRKSYPDKAAMGILSFDIKEIRLLDKETAFILGAWHLKREKDEPKGFFTLLMRKVAGQWLVVADHSS